MLMLVHSELFARQLPATYSAADSIKIEQLLSAFANDKDAHRVEPMVGFARKFIGTPYVAKTLEINANEQLIVNTRELDCSTYLETVLALTLCAKDNKQSFNQYKHMLAKIRYMNDTIAYTTRLHYFTWWLDFNSKKHIVKEIQSPDPPFAAIQTVDVHYMSAHTEQYPMLTGRLDFQEDIALMENNYKGKQYRYIPKEELKNNELLRQTIHDGDIIGIVTNKDGLDIAHVGIAVWHTDGLHMLHASMVKKQVIEDPQRLQDYLMARKTHLGIRIARVK